MKKYIQATRLPFITASALSVILAGIWVSSNQSIFDWPLFLLSLFGVVFVHLGANTINDYFDWNKSDKINKAAGPFSGGSRSALEGKLKRKDFLLISTAMFILALIILFLIMRMDRELVLVIALIGVLIGILYSMPPFNLQSRGLGEILILIAFGPLITLGTGYVLTGSIQPVHFMIGLPAGLFVTAIIWINEFPDFIADKGSGKKTQVVRMGLSSARYIHLIILLLAYLSIIALAIANIFPYWSLIALITFPLAFKSLSILWQKYDNPKELVAAQGLTIMLHLVTTVVLSISLFF